MGVKKRMTILNTYGIIEADLLSPLNGDDLIDAFSEKNEEEKSTGISIIFTYNSSTASE